MKIEQVNRNGIIGITTARRYRMRIIAHDIGIFLNDR